MIKLALLVLGFLLISSHAHAQTTFVPGSTYCSSNWSASGTNPVTLTLPASVTENCLANNGKYSGKWCFKYTPASLGWVESVGVGYNTQINAYPFNGGAGIGDDINDTGYIFSSMGYGAAGILTFRSSPSINISTSLGPTTAFCVNMDSNPRQIWFTPDITGTSGFGGGPLWNNSNTSSPSQPGTGSGTFGPPDTGQTGLQFFLVAAFPMMTGANSSGHVPTGDFDFTSTINSAITSAGYLPWNTSGGGPSVPGPLNPMTRNIANAPRWQQNTSYPNIGSRVLAGPAYNPSTGITTNGQPLYLWAVLPGSGGTSGNNASYAGHFGTAPCPSPANIGGVVGPGGYTNSAAGTWAAATHVVDGTVTWVCLTSVDYDTFTGANIDDPVSWATSTGYFNQQFVLTAAGNAYFLAEGQAGLSGLTCTSSSSGTGPSGTTFGVSSSDGSCGWIYQGTLGYSSKANIAPHELMSYACCIGAPGTRLGYVPQYNYHITTQLWWGGTTSQVYENNSGGESEQIFMTLRFNQPYDSGYGGGCPGAAGFGQNTVACYDLTQHVTPAPGDSFSVNMNPASDPLRYDTTKGVAIHSSVTYTYMGGLTSGAVPTQVGESFAFDDCCVEVDHLMLKSVSGMGLGIGSAGPGHYNSYGPNIHHNIIDDGGGIMTTSTTGDFFRNLHILRGTNFASPNQAWGNKNHYGGSVRQNTLIGPDIATAPGSYGCSGCIAMQQDKGSNYGPLLPAPQPSPLQNNLAFGWSQEVSKWYDASGADVFNCDYENTGQCAGSGNTFPFNSGGTATDALSSYTGGTVLSSGVDNVSGNPPTVITLAYPGGDVMKCGPSNNQSCFGLLATDVFVNPVLNPATEDWRLKSGSKVIGAGNNFFFTNTTFGTMTPGTDIYDRTVGSNVDIGAANFTAGTPTTTGAGNSLRRLLHQ